MARYFKTYCATTMRKWQISMNTTLYGLHTHLFFQEVKNEITVQCPSLQLPENTCNYSFRLNFRISALQQGRKRKIFPLASHRCMNVLVEYSSLLARSRGCCMLLGLGSWSPHPPNSWYISDKGSCWLRKFPIFYLDMLCSSK